MIISNTITQTRSLTLRVNGARIFMALAQLGMFASLLGVEPFELLLGQVSHNSGHIAVTEHIDGRSNAIPTC